MGETAVKFRIYIHQHVYAPFRRQTDAQAAGLIIGKVIQLIIGLFLQAQDLSGIIYVNLPGFCQAEIIFAPMEKLLAQIGRASCRERV